MSADSCHEVTGWKDIAAAIGGVSTKTAQRLATRRLGALPVKSDHRGVYAVVAELRQWVCEQTRSYQDRLRARRAA